MPTLSLLSPNQLEKFRAGLCNTTRDIVKIVRLKFFSKHYLAKYLYVNNHLCKTIHVDLQPIRAKYSALAESTSQCLCGLHFIGKKSVFRHRRSCEFYSNKKEKQNGVSESGCIGNSSTTFEASK